MIKKIIAGVCLCIFVITYIVTAAISNNKISFIDVEHTKVYNTIYNDLNTDIVAGSVVLIDEHILMFNTNTVLTLVEEHECVNDNSIQYIKEDNYTFYIHTTKKYNQKEFCCYIYNTYIVEKV